MIAIGCDHGGYEMKLEIIKYLEKKGLAYKDFGCASTESADYPVYGKAVAKAVAPQSPRRCRWIAASTSV